MVIVIESVHQRPYNCTPHACPRHHTAARPAKTHHMVHAWHRLCRTATPTRISSGRPNHAPFPHPAPSTPCMPPHCQVSQQSTIQNVTLRQLVPQQSSSAAIHPCLLHPSLHGINQPCCYHAANPAQNNLTLNPMIDTCSSSIGSILQGVSSAWGARGGQQSPFAQHLSSVMPTQPNTAAPPAGCVAGCRWLRPVLCDLCDGLGHPEAAVDVQTTV